MLTFPRLFAVIISIVVQVIRALSRSRADLLLENLALRQQLATLKSKRPGPRLTRGSTEVPGTRITRMLDHRPSFAVEKEDVEAKADSVPEIKPGDEVYLA